MFTNELRNQAVEILDGCRKKGLKLTAAESCTGGLISALLTEIPGASDAFERGFVTYSNKSKSDMLGVDAALIRDHGAVSDEVATAMAEAALDEARADVAVAVTGIAGPSGGTAEKPVGLVYVAVMTRKNLMVSKNNFSGDRNSIRLQSVAKALTMLQDSINHSSFSRVA